MTAACSSSTSAPRTASKGPERRSAAAWLTCVKSVANSMGISGWRGPGGNGPPQIPTTPPPAPPPASRLKPGQPEPQLLRDVEAEDGDPRARVHQHRDGAAVERPVRVEVADAAHRQGHPRVTVLL